ncbi:MAG: AAA family ATPase [Acidobacteriota bacterium]
MGNDKLIVFDPFCLDVANELLRKGSQAIKLRPKAFAVLAYLLERPGQLVTKEALLTAVWSGTFVGDAVLKVVVRQIREALGDDPRSPRFIETAHRRGYRFIGVSAEDGHTPAVVRPTESRSTAADSPLHTPDFPKDVVGRDQALSRMNGWLERMLKGERQIVFVTGEAGIGKTAVVDAFARTVASRGIRIGRGQCLEQYGTGEAYLPILEAVGRLAREEPHLVALLRTHAPMWLLQMPSLVSPSDRESLSREVFGATRERMLREMGQSFETLAADVPLVLILEDLHWSDYSTLDLISYVARHTQPVRLLLIGTYRPVDVIVSGHPLKAVKQELQSKQCCQELPLECLSERSTGDYLSVRFPTNGFPVALARLIHNRTDGNSLFMVNVVDYLVAEGLIVRRDNGRWDLAVEIDNVEVGVPDNVKQMIERQIEHLDANDQRTLEAASVAGAEFTTLAVVAGLEETPASVQARCDELARRRQFIQDSGVHVLPNGEAVSGFRFIHSLYRNVLYERVPASRRARIHRRIGEASEQLYGPRAGEIAAELAMHFELGSGYIPALKYLRLASENAIRRFAYKEAIGLARRGLQLIERVPDTPVRARQELGLLITLGVPLIATQGYGAPDVGNVYMKARELCQQLGDAPEMPQVLWGLWTFHLLRAEIGQTRVIAVDFLRQAGHVPYAELAMEVTLIHLGEFTPGIEHFGKALSLYDPESHRDDALRYSQNAGVGAQCHAAWAMWCLGQPDQALDQIQNALALSRRLSDPHGVAHALFFAAILHQLRREARLAQDYAEASIAISREHGLVLYEAMATTTRGWALLEQGRSEAIAQMRQGLAAQQATGTQVLRPHFLALLADGLRHAGETEEGLRVLEEALTLADGNGDRYYQAELYRLKGEAVLLRNGPAKSHSRAAGPGDAVIEAGPRMALQAEGCFLQAIAIAQKQKAISWELRATMSLARLHRRQGKRDEARDRLARISSAFTEGSGTTDLRDARALIDELS